MSSVATFGGQMIHRTRNVTAYQGPDRRTRAGVGQLRADRSWRLAWPVLAVTSSTVVWLTLESRFDAAEQAALASVTAVALILALTLAITAHIHWRATGEAAGTHVSTVGWLLVATAGFELWNGFVPAHGTDALVRSSLSLTAALWLAMAATGPEVDTASSPGRQLVRAGAAVTLVVAAGILLSVVAASGPVVAVTLPLAAAGAWGLTAALTLHRAAHGSTVLLGWMAWLAVAMTLAELGLAWAVTTGDAWVFAAASIRAAGCLLGAAGVAYALARTTAVRREGIHDATIREQRLLDERVAERETDAHELRNALIALDAATKILRDHRDELPPRQLHELDDSVAAGISQLRALLAGGAGDDRDPVPLLEVAQQQASLARLRGMAVEVDGDHDVAVPCARRMVIQVLDNLITNAERHGHLDGQARVCLEVGWLDDRAAMRVLDQGPGIPPDQRAMIFAPGVRLSTERPGHGLGLAIARQQVRQHGGDLWAEEAPDGGACFVVVLPAGTAARPSWPTDDPHHGLEVRDRSDGTDLSAGPSRINRTI
jgi:signal transduction histidine kinase